jgi:hypothetical protein
MGHANDRVKLEAIQGVSTDSGWCWAPGDLFVAPPFVSANWGGTPSLLPGRKPFGFCCLQAIGDTKIVIPKGLWLK